MIARTHRPFWDLFGALPADIQLQARQQFALWQADPWHPSLQFRQIALGLYSVRISRQYRAPARVRGDLAVWFWIGSHADYDRQLQQR